MRLLSSRPFLLVLTGAALMACDGTGPDQAGPPASLDIISGDLQTATAGGELPQPLVVEVTDDKGKPVEGQVVNFVVVAGGGSVFAGTALTNKDGRAQERWTLGTTARDTQKVEARAVDPATGQALVFATFRAVATPGAPAALAKVSGDAQTGAPGVALADSLAVRLTDAFGNGISGQSVAFSVAGGGSVLPATRTTGADGVARAAWTLGTTLGTPQTASATFGTLPAAGFTATMVAGGTLTRTGGVTQTGTAGAVLLDSLAVRFTTPTGAPIQGAVIQWAGPGVLTPATSTTDANGYARTSWRLPTAAGTYQATANLSGASEMLAFTATANAGAPAAITRVSGDAQSGDAGAVLDSLAVRVTDANGNPVPGAAVTFAAAGGGSVSPATVLTGANGVARTRWTLGTNVSLAQTVSASVAGLPPVTFTATTTLGGVLTRTGGNGQSAPAGTRLADSLEVRFTTAGGAPIQGATIQWNANAWDTPTPAVSTTGADGRARTSLQLGTLAGSRSVSAAVTGAAGSVIFAATALPGAPAQILTAVSPGEVPRGTSAAVTARVADAYDNPIPGVTVAWASICGGPVTPASSVTNGSGVAGTSWLIQDDCSATSYRGTATVAGLPSDPFEPLTVVSGAPARVDIGGDSTVSLAAGSVLFRPRVYDSGNRYIEPYAGCRYRCYQFTWTSSDTTVASLKTTYDDGVDTDVGEARFILRGPGTAVITARSQTGTYADSVVLTVTGTALRAAPPAAARRPASAPRAPAARPATRPRGR